MIDLENIPASVTLSDFSPVVARSGQWLSDVLKTGLLIVVLIGEFSFDRGLFTLSLTGTSRSLLDMNTRK